MGDWGMESSGTDSALSDASSDDEAYARFVSRLDVGTGPGVGSDGGARNGNAEKKPGQAGASDSAEEEAEWERRPRTSYTGVAGSDSDGDAEGRAGSRLPVRTLGGGRLKALQSTAASRHVPAAAATAAAVAAAAGDDANTADPAPVAGAESGASDVRVDQGAGEGPHAEAVAGAGGRSRKQQPTGRLSMASDDWLAMTPKAQDKRYQRTKALVANLAQRIMAWPEVCISGAPHNGSIGPIQAPPAPVRGKQQAGDDGDGDGEGGGDTADALSRRKARRLANKERVRKERAQSQQSRKCDLLLALHSLVHDADSRVARMALLSEAAVFMDILPDFRIRLPTDKEAAVRVSREVKEARAFDSALLRGYQRCLKTLEKLMMAAPTTRSPGGGGDAGDGTAQSLAVVAIKCMSKLMAARPGFNFGSNLIATVVRASCDSRDPIRTEACQSLASLLRSDQSGGPSVEVAKAMSALAKQRLSSLHPAAIRLLQMIPLASKRGGRKRKGKGKRGIDGQLQSDLDLADANDVTRRSSNRTAVIEHVIALYFRVLRGFGRLSSTRYHRLLQAVLQNLGKVAHVIDVKVALEVMAIFRTMITDGDMPGTADSGGSRLPLATVVHVVLAAVAVLHGPGGELLRDEDDGYLVDAVCAALPQLVLPMNQHRDVVAAVIKCTEALMLQRREPDLARVRRLCKTAAASALHLPAHQAAAVVCVAEAVMHRYTRSQQALIGSELDAAASGGVAHAISRQALSGAALPHEVAAQPGRDAATADGDAPADMLDLAYVVSRTSSAGAEVVRMPSDGANGVGGERAPKRRRTQRRSRHSGESLVATVAALPPVVECPLWELGSTVLQRHFHPVVAGCAGRALVLEWAGAQAKTGQGKPADAVAASLLHKPMLALASLDASAGGFNPPVVVPRKHPLITAGTRGAATEAKRAKFERKAKFLRTPQDISRGMQGEGDAEGGCEQLEGRLPSARFAPYFASTMQWRRQAWEALLDRLRRTQVSWVAQQKKQKH